MPSVVKRSDKYDWGFLKFVIPVVVFSIAFGIWWFGWGYFDKIYGRRRRRGNPWPIKRANQLLAKESIQYEEGALPANGPGNYDVGLSPLYIPPSEPPHAAVRSTRNTN